MSVLFKKKTAATAVFIIAALTIIIFLLGSSMKKAGTPESNEVIRPVSVTLALRGDLDRQLHLNGYIESENIVTIVPYVSGTLEQLLVKTGDEVSRDQLLAVIDSRAYDLQLKQAEAAYFGAESSYRRIEQLYNSNAATRQSYDQAKSQYEAYKSQYELAQLQVSYTRITAPINGTVLMLHSNQGAIAAPELPLLTLGSLTDLIVKLDVPDKYYETFSSFPDMKVGIRRPAADTPDAPAHVSSVSPVISPSTRNFKIECSLDDNVDAFRPGMFVHCSFSISSMQDVCYLPNRVMGASGSVWYVNEEDSTARRIEPSVLFRNNEYFAIPDELADYRFITEGQSFLSPGQKIRIKKVSQ